MVEATKAVVETFFQANGSKEKTGRSGKLLGKIETPCSTVITQRGLPAYLSRDLLDALPGTNLLQLPLSDMIPAKEHIDAADKASSESVGVKEHYNIGEQRVSFMSFRNPRTEGDVFGGDSGLTIEGVSGRQKVDVPKIVGIQNVLKCDIITSPAEEAPIGQSGTQKTCRAVKNGGKFLQQLLSERENGAFSGRILANLQGGKDSDQRGRAVKLAVATNSDGFSLGGLGYHESATDRATALSLMCEQLPEEKPRFLPLIHGCPVEVLQAIFHGVDVIETDYPTEMARAGYAFLFETNFEVKKHDGSDEDKKALLSKYLTSATPPTIPEAKPAGPPPKKKGRAGQAPKVTEKVAGYHNVKVLNCQAEERIGDTSPICDDSFVKQYSQAYIHHLYQCGELLGTMLVSEHNLNKYNDLFTAVRKHLDEGSFLDFALTFMETQTDM